MDGDRALGRVENWEGGALGGVDHCEGWSIGRGGALGGVEYWEGWSIGKGGALVEHWEGYFQPIKCMCICEFVMCVFE